MGRLLLYTCWLLSLFSITLSIKCPPVPQVEYKCISETKPLITLNEGFRQCVYWDTSKPPKRTIGIGYCFELGESPKGCKFQDEVERDMCSIGADFEELINAEPLKSGSTNQDCLNAKKFLLTEPQVYMLFNISFDKAVQISRQKMPGLEDVCCNASAVITDLMYNTGGHTFNKENYGQFMDFLNTEQWSGAAEVLKQCHVKGYCASPARCDRAHERINSGCGCTYGGCPSSSLPPAPVCSGSNSDHYAICQYSYASKGKCCERSTLCTDDGAQGRVLKYTGKCDTCESTCCTRSNATIGSSCCAPGSPVCCQNVRGCCQNAYPTCCDFGACCEKGFPVCCGSPQRGWCCGPDQTCTSSGCKSASGAEHEPGHMVPGIPNE